MFQSTALRLRRLCQKTLPEELDVLYIYRMAEICGKRRSAPHWQSVIGSTVCQW